MAMIFLDHVFNTLLALQTAETKPVTNLRNTKNA
jgi:hypothetical protein